MGLDDGCFYTVITGSLDINSNPERIVDNRLEWKNKEMRRLFPNSLCRDVYEMSWIVRGFGLNSIMNFNLREFAKEYKADESL